MPIITKIEEQKNQNRVNLYIDHEFFTGINKEIVFSLKLKEGQGVEVEKLQFIVSEELYSSAKNKALSLLSFTSRSEKEMRDRLKNHEYDEKTIDRVIRFLKEYEFIDDEELTKRMVKNKFSQKRYGQNRIKQDLYRKGLDKDMVENTIKQEIDENEEFNNAMALARRKMDSIKDEDHRKIYEKLARHLSYRGFDYDTIKRVLNKILGEELY